MEWLAREPASERGLAGAQSMTHSHQHLHDKSSYYLEQLCTIAVCGLLGGVAVMLYYQEMLRFILADFLHKYVLWSGFGLLGLAALRGAFLWLSFGRADGTQPHDHCQHDHDACDHVDDHNNEDHQASEPVAIASDPHHDHGHSHAWKPWRYCVMCLPIMLYFLNMPNQGLSSATALDVEESDHPVVAKQGEILNLGFREMERWAFSQQQREYFEGRKGSIKGQFLPKNDGGFTLVRFRRTCCAADAIELRVAIICPDIVTHIKKMKWVEVTGEIQFRKRRGREEYVPVLKLQSRNDVQPAEPDYNPYIE
jgi:hypothetical protein